MGFFGTYLYENGRWSGGKPDGPPLGAGPWLLIDVYDSDFTTISYAPADAGTGMAYLGWTPRNYFEDPRESEPTDPAMEAAGLADWWAARNGAGEAERNAMEARLRPYLASDDDPFEELDDDEDDADLDDAEIFVEIKTARFLRALNLPLPADLQPLASR